MALWWQVQVRRDPGDSVGQCWEEAAWGACRVLSLIPHPSARRAYHCVDCRAGVRARCARFDLLDHTCRSCVSPVPRPWHVGSKRGFLSRMKDSILLLSHLRQTLSVLQRDLGDGQLHVMGCENEVEAGAHRVTFRRLKTGKGRGLTLPPPSPYVPPPAAFPSCPDLT